MSEQARQHARNVMVLALANRHVGPEQKDFIRRLCRELGLDAEQVRQLCSEVREAPSELSIPEDPQQREALLGEMVAVARVDGEIDDAERRMLLEFVSSAGLDAADLDALLSGGRRNQQIEEDAERLLEACYAGFAGWDEATRREKLREVAGLGRDAVIPLLRLLESYREPDSMDDALELKTLVAEQLGELGDARAVYYLAQLVNLGDSDDEICDARLRTASAGAIGRIAGLDVPEGAEGVEAVRQWWRMPAAKRYDQLAF
jgi:DNA-binding transcriptional MerR regulator